MSISSGSKYPNSRLRRTNPPGAAPVTQSSSPSLSPSSSSSSLSSSSSSSSSSNTSSSSSPATSLSSSAPPTRESWRPQAASHPSKTVGSWRSGGPLQPTDKKTSWAKKGAIGHLPTYSADDHKDSCLAKKIEGETFKVEGFFSHPVLILSDPDDKGRVKIFPLTTWGGKSIEEKWKDMEDSKKAKKFSHFCQIEHPGVEATLPELSLMDGGRIQRRSYVNMETCWEVEESILNKYRGNKGDSVLFVTPRSFKIVENYANSKQML
ncbi:uncharacterized protein J3D65DRAFT_606225 [Phyllosticta citribraziliensis]|uniref:Uncharacterized protein n=1 Tax=Phyllosticta citribraziliensis TaxID=989973 RepID=A0ABR1LC85_9PEZI